MFNFGWGVLFVLVNFALFLICYRLFGRQGLYAWVSAAVILANIQVVKTIELFGFVMTLGNTMFSTLNLTTDLLNEKYGEKEAKKVVWFGFFFLFISIVIMQMALVFQDFESDLPVQSSMETIFGMIPRVALGSLIAYLTSQYLDVKLFSKIRSKFSSRGQLWIRVNGSTLVSQLVDSFIFCTIAFAGVYEWSVWWEIVWTTYLIKFVISAVSTPVVYLARNFKLKEE